MPVTSLERSECSYTTHTSPKRLHNNRLSTTQLFIDFSPRPTNLPLPPQSANTEVYHHTSRQYLPCCTASPPTRTIPAPQPYLWQSLPYPPVRLSVGATATYSLSLCTILCLAREQGCCLSPGCGWLAGRAVAGQAGHGRAEMAVAVAVAVAVAGFGMGWDGMGWGEILGRGMEWFGLSVRGLTGLRCSVSKITAEAEKMTWVK
ncbi:hypothetical protein IWZ03DRAFT_50204 [Phyllosticta citriasiana]|uniref:Uncharacterized protein n=1 Tax=Phyllosticta citriasiana TaxID=595635 RepID=A0ABR1KC46_9PEZI